jgi:hypothetical protein
MTKRFMTALLLAAGFTASAAAQNEIFHHDGTTEATSRGTTGTNAKTLLQRLPGDMTGGATGTIEHVMVVQDQNGTTTESFTYEVRADNPASPNSPDMAPAGLLGSAGPFTLTFPCPGVPCALIITLTLGAPIPVPAPGTSGTPSGDFYVGLAFPPAPLWTADGISNWISFTSGSNAGEQMNTAATGYPPGGVGGSGLGWQYDATLLTPPSLASGNRVWYNTTRLVDNTSQPFADNPTAFTGVNSGLNPNYGCAGIWPDLTRTGGSTDKIGVRVRTIEPLGTPVLLIYGLSTIAPTAVPGVGGLLSIAPPFQITAAVSTVIPPSGLHSQNAAETEAVFGPATAPAFVVGKTIYVQGVVLGVSGPSFSTMSKFNIVN